MKFILGIITAILIFGTLHGQSPDLSKLLYKIDGKEIAYPRLSKNGDVILYQTNEFGNWQLALLHIDSGRVHRIMTDEFNNNFPDWSADNEWIAFVSDRDGNEEIYLMRTDGSELKRITHDEGRDIHPYFSPDGKYLLFNSTRNNGSFDVYRYAIDDGSLLRMTDTPEDETCARYSPDMSRIVLLQNSHVIDDVMLMNAKTFKIKNLSQTPDIRDGWPMFSHDNEWVYYSSFETGDYCIYRIKPDGREKTKLTTAGPGEEDARVYVARDCKSLIYNKRIGKTIEIRALNI